MKKFLVFATMIIVSLHTFGQTDPIRQKLDSIFQHVNKSQIPTGYLKEYGAEFMPLHWFNGVITDSNIVANIDAFRAVYDDIATAKIQSHLPTMTDLSVVNTRIDSLRAADVASPIALLYGNYASLKDNALNLNLFTVSNQQIYDVPGRTQSPYQTNTLFAAASIDKEFTNTVTFTYKPVLYFSNTSVSVSQLAVDFKDGTGYHIIPVNGTVSKTYSDSSSTKLINLRAKLSTGAYVYCHSSVDVFVTNTGMGSRYIGTDPYAREVPVPVVLGEGLGGDVMQIRYSVNNPTRTNQTPHLRKPLIYVEGYDVSGKYNIMNLIRGDGGVDNWGEWVTLAAAVDGYDFMHYLDDIAGYDLVFVNYNTLRSFEANSKMLQHVIEWVKADKAAGGSTEKNVVLGVSAGGVLARYTLARMTKFISPASTDTRLLITHDSPHQGANVPLAFQHFLYDLGNSKVLGKKIKDKKEDLKNFYELNTKPATAQLLRARVIDDQGTVGFNTFLNGPSSPYQQMIDFSLSPNKPIYGFVATAQGSQCGVPVMTSDGLPLADFDGEFSFVRFKLIYIPTAGKTKYFLKTQLNALPSSGISQIEYYKFSRRFSFFGIGFGTKTIDEYSRDNPSGFTKWDAAPGSTQSIKDRTGGALTTGLTKQKLDWYLTPILRIRAGLDMNITQDLFSFVSTTSALDAPNGTPLNSVYVFPVSGTAKTSAAKYLAQKKFTEMGSTYFNANHTDYTARNALWIYNEIQSVSQSYECEDYCGVSSIPMIGSPTICSCETYSIDGLSPGTTVTWSASPSGVVSLSPTGNSVSVCKIKNGIVTLKAVIISSLCGNGSITKEIVVGQKKPGTISWEWNAPPKRVTLTADAVSGATSYQWYLNGVLKATTTLPNYILPMAGNVSCGNYYYFGVKAVGTCGTSDESYVYAQMPPCDFSYKVSPIPAVEHIRIELLNEVAGNTGKQMAGIQKIEVYDKMGVNRLKTDFAKIQKTASFSIASLPNDIYTLRIFDGQTWQSCKIVVQR